MEEGFGDFELGRDPSGHLRSDPKEDGDSGEREKVVWVGAAHTRRILAWRMLKCACPSETMEDCLKTKKRPKTAAVLPSVHGEEAYRGKKYFARAVSRSGVLGTCIRTSSQAGVKFSGEI